MKRMTIVLLAAVLLLATALLFTTGAALTQSSDSFDLSWNVIAAGGSESASSNFEVRGTIGQPLAGPPPSSSAQFTIESGFWAGVPQLAPSPDNLELYLPVIAHGD